MSFDTEAMNLLLYSPAEGEESQATLAPPGRTFDVFNESDAPSLIEAKTVSTHADRSETDCESEPEPETSAATNQTNRFDCTTPIVSLSHIIIKPPLCDATMK